jgi:hypothetical protein
VSIPGFLFVDTSTVSRLDAAGQVATEILPQARLGLSDIALPAGRWTLTLDTDQGGPLNVWVDGKAADRIALNLPDHAQIEISNPGDRPVYLRRAVLTRTAPHEEASP